MQDRKPDLYVPVIFQKLNQFDIDDTRFMRVKIWLMHLGENLNGSYFEKEVVIPAIPTLSNTPILAYIEDSFDDEIDFSDHRIILLKEDGDIKLKYLCQAIGVIPESNNAQFEFRLCDDGIEREFLTVEGLVWQNKWDDAPNILNRDLIKSQSMELHTDYTGEFKEDNLFHFTSFKFYGACALGKNVLPAMHNASIEVQFAMDKFAKDIQEKMEQFKNYQNHISDKEVDIINLQSFEEGGKSDLNKKLEILTKYNLTVEQLDFSIDELTLEDLELKLKEFTAKQESASINPEEPKEPTPKDFSISHSVLISEISKILESMTVIKTNRWGETWQAPQYYYMDIKDNYVIIVTNAWDTYYGVPYVINGDAITMDFNAKVEFIPDWRAKQDGETTNFSIINEVHEAEIAKAFEKFETLQTEKVKIEKQLTESNEKFSSIQTEIDSLKEFKASKLAKERKEAEDALFAQYEALKGVEEFETLKEQASKFASVEDLEKEIALIYVRKNAKFSVSNKKDTLTVNIKVNKIDEEEAPYGGIFEKYNKV